MRTDHFNRLKGRLGRELTADQCVELEEHLRGVIAERASETSIAQRERELARERRCPRCGHDDVVGHGRDAQQRRRFRCRRTDAGGCGRTFNALTGTALAGMRKPEKWAAFVRRMGAFTSVQDVAASDIGVSRLTAWRWRLRFLRAAAEIQSGTVGGVVEVDETFFRTSYKGSRGWRNGEPPEDRPPRYRGGPALKAGLSGEQVPVLAALDRNGGIIEDVLASRRGIEQSLRGRIRPGSVICSDGLRAYANVAERTRSEHRRIHRPKRTWLTKALGDRRRTPGRLGLGHVNAHHERVKTFVNRTARGVSTKYLPLYLGWLRAIRAGRTDPETVLEQALSTR